METRMFDLVFVSLKSVCIPQKGLTQGSSSRATWKYVFPKREKFKSTKCEECVFSYFWTNLTHTHTYTCIQERIARYQHFNYSYAELNTACVAFDSRSAYIIFYAIVVDAYHVQLITWSNICKDNRVHNHCHLELYVCFIFQYIQSTLFLSRTRIHAYTHLHNSHLFSFNSRVSPKIYTIPNERRIPRFLLYFLTKKKMKKK